MIERATGPIHGGSSLESGFEPGTLLLQSRDLTTRPPRPQKGKGQQLGPILPQSEKKGGKEKKSDERECHREEKCGTFPLGLSFPTFPPLSTISLGQSSGLHVQRSVDTAHLDFNRLDI
ncbi:hypothetical protein AVEN_68634-1 [Araneus ventricosus]|uniref:Uncharacterized protein n=1 Tax=Araneus ventricosus TaxID=182803 RepID=A0A4Y2QLW0_ARAVE|nr:hypothetical protein AVEN_68634-1 [Araneus ventricosus]